MAAALASAALAVASAASAAALHCASVTWASLAPTPATAAAAADSDDTPSPTRTQASSGSAAASPQTPTGLFTARPAFTAVATSNSTAGCQGSVSVASSADIRSAAIVYWVRSLVPIDRKSTCSRMRSASNAAAGTSIITPGVSPYERVCAAKASASAGVAIIGAITHGVAARPLRRGGDRLQLAGQDAWVAVSDADAAHTHRGVGLLRVSDELQRLVRSRVKRADDHLAAVERLEHVPVDLGLLVDGGLVVAVEEAQFGAEQADALGGRLARRPGGGTVLDVGEDRDDVAVGRGTRTGPALGEIGLALRHLDCPGCGTGVGLDGDGAERAVDHHHHARRDGVEAVDRDHAGDAELTGDDRGVAGGTAQRRRERNHQGRVQTRGVDGGEVLGAQDRRHVRHRHAGFGQAAEVGDDAVADVAKVGDPFGHHPAELGEHGRDLVDCACDRLRGGGAAADPLLGVGQPGPVLRQRRRGGEHLRGDARRVRRPRPQPFGHRRRGRGEPRHLGGSVGFVQFGER